jgi:tripartite-type tricarboxylate transporter receptor subunit TctC
MKGLAHLLACMVLCSAAFPAGAQSYPAKPIRVVLPFPPGSGGIDLMARLVGGKIQEAMGQPMLIESRPGASGTIAAEFVARSAPDGHTLFFTTPGVIVTSMFMLKSLPYDPIRDFTPVTAAVEPATCIVVNASFPVNSARELIEYAKQNPNGVFYASNGIGSFFHLTGEMINQLAGTSMVHVPYKGSTPVITDLLSGRIQMAMNSVASMSPQIRTGKLKILAVMESPRFAGLPDVPSLSETLPAFEKPATWWGYFGPGSTPQPIAVRLQSEIARALRSQELRQTLEENALTVIANTPDQFSAMYRNGFDVYARAFKAAGVKPE